MEEKGKIDVVPRTQKEEELKNVSTLFSELTLSLSERYPAKVLRAKETNMELTEREREIVNILINYSPKQVTDAIFRNPPTVIAYDEDKFDRESGTGPTISLNPGRFTFYSPSNEDKEYAKREIPSPRDSMSELFQSNIKIIKNHFLAPTVLDRFEDHRTQRAPWERGITNTLMIIGKAAATESEERDEADFAFEFRHRFNFNKLGGTRGQVLTALKAIAIATEKNKPLQDEVYGFVRKWNAIPKESVILHAQEVTSLAKEALDFFSEET